MATQQPQAHLNHHTPERMASGRTDPLPEMLPQIELREFVSARLGATGLSTGTATFQPGAELPYHVHPCSEAITILAGVATVAVQGRAYRLSPLDSIHVPAGIAHRVTTGSPGEGMTAHWAFATDQPVREFVEDTFPVQDMGDGTASEFDPEYVMRFRAQTPYELADGTRFYDLFAGRFGSVGICGGYGEFNEGTGLPCHTHDYDESITIVKGSAHCFVAGRKYLLSDCDTALVPRGNPHRFVNAAAATMGMIWVYAGSEPERALVDVRYCEGQLVWPK